MGKTKKHAKAGKKKRAHEKKPRKQLKMSADSSSSSSRTLPKDKKRNKKQKRRASKGTEIGAVKRSKNAPGDKDLESNMVLSSSSTDAPHHRQCSEPEVVASSESNEDVEPGPAAALALATTEQARTLGVQDVPPLQERTDKYSSAADKDTDISVSDDREKKRIDVSFSQPDDDKGLKEKAALSNLADLVTYPHGPERTPTSHRDDSQPQNVQDQEPLRSETEPSVEEKTAVGSPQIVSTKSAPERALPAGNSQGDFYSETTHTGFEIIETHPVIESIASCAAEVRELAIRSERYAENVFEAGHKSVWGSFYDIAQHQWGYSCCRLTKRGQTCPRVDLEPNFGRIRLPKQLRDLQHYEPLPVKWRHPPKEFQQRSDFEDTERYVAHFLRYTMGQWRKMLVSGSAVVCGVNVTDQSLLKVFQSEEVMLQTELALAPLVQQCEDEVLRIQAREKELAEIEHLASRAMFGYNMLKFGGTQVPDQTPQMGMLERLENMALCAHARDYAAANQHYIKLTLGSKKWHQAYHGGEGKMNSGFKLHTVSASALSSFDRDAKVNDYVLAFRRVLQFCQLVRPNADISKHI